MAVKPRPRPAPAMDEARREGLYSIGEAARSSGVSAKMIRHYERSGLLGPAVRSAANYRLYDAADIHQLRFIKRARQLGFGSGQIAELVSLWQDTGRSSREVKDLVLAHVAQIDERIRALQEMRTAVARLADACHGDQRPQCPILDELAAPRPSAAADARP